MTGALLFSTRVYKEQIMRYLGFSNSEGPELTIFMQVHLLSIQNNKNLKHTAWVLISHVGLVANV